jgi:hypothetical protein
MIFVLHHFDVSSLLVELVVAVVSIALPIQEVHFIYFFSTPSFRSTAGVIDFN